MQSSESPTKLFKFWKEVRDAVIELHVSYTIFCTLLMLTHSQKKLSARYIELGIQSLVSSKLLFNITRFTLMFH